MATVSVKVDAGTLVTTLKAQKTWANGAWQVTGYIASGVDKYSDTPLEGAQTRNGADSPYGYFRTSVPGKEKFILDANGRPISDLQQARARVQEMMRHGELKAITDGNERRKEDNLIQLAAIMQATGAQSLEPRKPIIPLSKRFERMSVEEKLTHSLQVAIRFAPESIKAELQGLLNPQSVAIMVAFAASHTVGVGQAADVVGAVLLGKQALELVVKFVDAIRISITAPNIWGLEDAGKQMSDAFAQGAATVTLALGAMGLKKVTGSVQTTITPELLKAQVAGQGALAQGYTGGQTINVTSQASNASASAPKQPTAGNVVAPQAIDVTAPPATTSQVPSVRRPIEGSANSVASISSAGKPAASSQGALTLPPNTTLPKFKAAVAALASLGQWAKFVEANRWVTTVPAVMRVVQEKGIELGQQAVKPRNPALAMNNNGKIDSTHQQMPANSGLPNVVAMATNLQGTPDGAKKGLAAIQKFLQLRSNLQKIFEQERINEPAKSYRRSDRENPNHDKYAIAELTELGFDVQIEAIPNRPGFEFLVAISGTQRFVVLNKDLETLVTPDQRVAGTGQSVSHNATLKRLLRDGVVPLANDRELEQLREFLAASPLKVSPVTMDELRKYGITTTGGIPKPPASNGFPARRENLEVFRQEDIRYITRSPNQELAVTPLIQERIAYGIVEYGDYFMNPTYSMSDKGNDHNRVLLALKRQLELANQSSDGALFRRMEQYFSEKDSMPYNERSGFPLRIVQEFWEYFPKDDSIRTLAVLAYNIQRSTLDANGNQTPVPLSVLSDWLLKIQSGYVSPGLSIKNVSEFVGKGVFAIHAISANSFIGEYQGISVQIDPVSSTSQNTTNRNYEYGFSVYGNPIVPYSIIDAALAGNETRYINHSDVPNVSPLHVTGLDGRVHVVFVTNRDIKPGEQLFINYGSNYWSGREAPKNIQSSSTSGSTANTNTGTSVNSGEP